jgi:hypothetical protein
MAASVASLIQRLALYEFGFGFRAREQLVDEVDAAVMAGQPRAGRPLLEMSIGYARWPLVYRKLAFSMHIGQYLHKLFRRAL